MEKKHHDYYQPLELRPWVLRHSQTSANTSIMVYGERLDSAAEQTLFTAMMNTIGLHHNDITFITVDQNPLHEITRIKPSLILVMGKEIPQDSVNELQALNVPLAVIAHPSHLLKHPQDKRDAYKELRKMTLIFP